MSKNTTTFTTEDAIDWLESLRESDPNFAVSMTDEEWKHLLLPSEMNEVKFVVWK